MSSSNVIVTHTIAQNCVAGNPSARGIVTRGMIRERAVELAVIEGRKPHEASKSDWENAKREMIKLPET